MKSDSKNVVVCSMFEYFHLNVKLCASDPRPLYEHLKDSPLLENCRRFLELFPNLLSTISSGCDSSIEFLALVCKFCPISDFVIFFCEVSQVPSISLQSAKPNLRSVQGCSI